MQHRRAGSGDEDGSGVPVLLIQEALILRADSSRHGWCSLHAFSPRRFAKCFTGIAAFDDRISS